MSELKRKLAHFGSCGLQFNFLSSMNRSLQDQKTKITGLTIAYVGPK